MTGYPCDSCQRGVLCPDGKTDCAYWKRCKAYRAWIRRAWRDATAEVRRYKTARNVRRLRQRRKEARDGEEA